MSDVPTMDDIREIMEAAAQEPEEDGPEGFTSSDLLKASGWGRSKVRDTLREMVEDGRVEYVGDRTSTRVDGKACRRPVYRYVGDE